MADQKEILTVEKYYQDRIRERDDQIQVLAADKQSHMRRINELKRDLKAEEKISESRRKILESIHKLMEE